jgi:hypothetical protein
MRLSSPALRARTSASDGSARDQNEDSVTGPPLRRVPRLPENGEFGLRQVCSENAQPVHHLLTLQQLLAAQRGEAAVAPQVNVAREQLQPRAGGRVDFRHQAKRIGPAREQIAQPPHRGRN